jgi:membrane protein DedA with SNARE-associated domain
MVPAHSHTFFSGILTTYQLPGIFLGTFCFGETVVIAATLLAVRGYWNASDVFIAAFAGTVTSDAAWYLLGHHVHRLLAGRSRTVPVRRRLLARLDRMTGRRPFLALLFVKFLYGTRILTIVYLAARKIGFKTFVLFDALGTAIWLAVLLPVAWTAGGSTAPLIPRLHELGAGLLALAGTVVLFRLLALWLGRKIAPR